jgi:hypothetical protein
MKRGDCSLLGIALAGCAYLRVLMYEKGTAEHRRGRARTAVAYVCGRGGRFA